MKDEIVKIKTSQVYSRIAVVSRNPKKTNERKMLITALNESYITINVDGTMVKRDPLYVTMKASDARACFGKNYDIICISANDV